MATAYTSLLGLALPVTGELSGTWGDTVNNSITQLVEDSVAGVASVSVTAGNVTLTTTGSGAANQARCAIIIATGTPGTARQIIAPSQSKAYIVINQSDSNVTFKGAATSGHLLKPGEANLLAWNGSDFIDIEQGDVTGPASATDNAVVRFDGTSGKLVQNSSVTIADTTGDIETSGKISVGDGSASLPSITNTGDTNTGIYFPAENQVGISTNGNFRALVDENGNVGLGVTPSAWSGVGTALQVGTSAAIIGNSAASASFIQNAYFDGTNYRYIGTAAASRFAVTAGTYSWNVAASGTAGNVITFTQAMTLSSGNLTLGTTTAPGANGAGIALYKDDFPRLTFRNSTTGDTTTDGTQLYMVSGDFYIINAENASLNFGTNGAQKLSVTAAGFTQPVAYADTVVALGNTGTATNINLQAGNVFTATLTGNCTFTLQNPIATGASSFTLILTNDGTAGRTVAWAGGSFNFPGGAATLSRTTTANATDIWAFFTPNGGTTWYGNIVMKDVKA